MVLLKDALMYAIPDATLRLILRFFAVVVVFAILRYAFLCALRAFVRGMCFFSQRHKDTKEFCLNPTVSP